MRKSVGQQILESLGFNLTEESDFESDQYTESYFDVTDERGTRGLEVTINFEYSCIYVHNPNAGTTDEIPLEVIAKVAGL